MLKGKESAIGVEILTPKYYSIFCFVLYGPLISKNLIMSPNYWSRLSLDEKVERNKLIYIVGQL